MGCPLYDKAVSSRKIQAYRSIWAFLACSRTAVRRVKYNTIGLVKWIDVDRARYCLPREAQEPCRPWLLGPAQEWFRRTLSFRRLPLTEQTFCFHWMKPALPIPCKKIESQSSSGHAEDVAADSPIRLLVLEVSNLRGNTFPCWRRLRGCAEREDWKDHRGKNPTVAMSVFLSPGNRCELPPSSSVDCEMIPKLKRNIKIHYPVKKVDVAAQIADFQCILHDIERQCAIEILSHL